jgi:hypothetical protein
MTNTVARKLEVQEQPVRSRRQAQVIPLYPSMYDRVRDWTTRTFTSEQGAEILLAVTAVVLTSVLFFSLYQGLQHYRVF